LTQAQKTPKPLGEADIIHKVNIISKAASFAKGKHHRKKGLYNKSQNKSGELRK